MAGGLPTEPKSIRRRRVIQLLHLTSEETLNRSLKKRGDTRERERGTLNFGPISLFIILQLGSYTLRPSLILYSKDSNMLSSPCSRVIPPP